MTIRVSDNGYSRKASCVSVLYRISRVETIHLQIKYSMYCK